MSDTLLCRHPQNAEDPACALPVLSELIRAIRNAEETREAAVSPMSTEHHRYVYKAVPIAVQTDCMNCSSVLDMDDQMLDDYLQFCEKALLPREDRMPGKSSSAAPAPAEESAETTL